MKAWILILLPVIASCTFIGNNNPSFSSESNDEKKWVLYDDSASYETIVMMEYNDQNQLVSEVTLSPSKSGIYLDTMSSTEDYKYQNGNLIYKICTYGSKPNIEESFFTYDSLNRLTSEIIVRNTKDTSKVVVKEYTEEKNVKIEKAIEYEKSPYILDISNIPFDTLYSLTKSFYSDSLEMKSQKFTGKSWSSLDLDMTWLISYDEKNRRTSTITLDAKGDTVLVVKKMYNNDKMIRTESYGEAYSTITLLDDNGLVQYLLSSENEEPYDTSFYYHDQNGNLTKIRYHF